MMIIEYGLTFELKSVSFYLKVASLDSSKTDELIKEIKAEYDFIREKLIKYGFEELTGEYRK